MKKQIRRKRQTNRGGTKIVYDGIEFKSRLEVYCYKKLKENGLEANYEIISFEILPPIYFEYNDKKTKTIRSMSYTPDFVGDNFIIECKGFASESFPLRWKVFKHYLHNNNMKYYLFMPRKQSDVDKTIKEILELKNRNKCL